MDHKGVFNFSSPPKLRSISLLAMAVCAAVVSSSAIAAQAEDLTELGLQIERYSKAVLMSDRGMANGYAQLRDGHNRISAQLKMLQNGRQGGTCTAPVPLPALQARLNVLSMKWEKVDRLGEKLVSLQGKLGQVRAAVKSIQDAEANMVEQTMQFSTLKVMNGGTPREISVAGLLTFLHMRLIKNANRILFDDVTDPEVAFLLAKDKGTFSDVLDGFLSGSKVLRLRAAKDKKEREKLLEISEKFEVKKNAATTIIDNLQFVVAAKLVTQELLARSEDLLGNLQDIRNDIPKDETCPEKPKS